VEKAQHNPWKTLDSRIIYATRWLRLREDKVITPSGARDTYAVVEILPSVGVIALTDDQQIALVLQWRYVHGKMSLEIPTGGSQTGESMVAAAQRELLEETGFAAGSWVAFGTVDNSNGSTTDVAHLFLATDLSKGSREVALRNQDAEPTEVTWVPFSEAVDLVMRGDITESVSVAAILKVALGKIRKRA
jgi:8-oxo-dGTP pyrophosphatase MutT (NUDIX family)